MKLFNNPITVASHGEIIKKIIAQADPHIALKDLARQKPSHHVSAWRRVVWWVLWRHYGLSQQKIAEYFGRNKNATGHAIRETDLIMAEDGPDAKRLRIILSAILDRKEIA